MALSTAERVCDAVGAIARWLCLLAGVILLLVMGVATCFDVVVFIQDKSVRLIGNGALVDHRLPVVLAGCFQLLEFK